MGEEREIVRTRRVAPVPTHQAVREVFPVVAAALVTAILQLLA